MKPYAQLEYARALQEFGDPLALPASGGWLLKRRIPGSDYYDAMGCYPLFSCRDWLALGTDFALLQGQLVSVTVVADPFGEYDASSLRRSFTAMARPFKHHYVVDLTQGGTSQISAHHRRNIRKAMQKVQVEWVADPAESLDEWCQLYDHLISRHHLRGITGFSRNSFAQQLALPGLVAFKAVNDEKTIGMVLWLCDQQLGYYHLGAYSDRGYELNASYALFASAIEHFSAAGLQSLSLGSGAGLNDDAADGLSRFKSGWSPETRNSYLCGRIFDEPRYAELAVARMQPKTAYFPAYRAGEFARAR